MNFEFSEDQQLFADSLARLLENWASANRKSDDAVDAGQLWMELCEIGALGALFDEDVGGFGGHRSYLIVVFTALGRAGVVEPVLEHGLVAGGVLARLGTAQQRDILAQAIAGETRVAFAHDEPDSRYDPMHVGMRATTGAEGSVIISGRKSLVIGANNADWLIVSVRETGEIDADDGVSLFLIPATTAGIEIQCYEAFTGGSAADIIFDRVEITKDQILGSNGSAGTTIKAVFADAIAAQGAHTLGAMETAMHMTGEYLKTRKQFGRPLASFQVLAHRYADMVIEMEQARSAVINAVGHLRSDAVLRDRHSAAAKNLLGRVGRQIAEECVQMHGGIAMTQEYALSSYIKQIIMADHRFGDCDYHLERFIDLTAEG